MTTTHITIAVEIDDTDPAAQAIFATLLQGAVASRVIVSYQVRPPASRPVAASRITLEDALDLVSSSNAYRKDFALWLSANWAVWERFELEANRTWSAGRDHYSARTLIEYIRHDTMLSEASGEWKINGNFVPDLSRLYGPVYPERDGFFEQRNQVQPNRQSAGVRATTVSVVKPEVREAAPVAAVREPAVTQEAVVAHQPEEVVDASVSDFMSWVRTGLQAGMPAEVDPEVEAALHAPGAY